MPAQALPPPFVQALHELGLAAPGDALHGVPLAGGVSSDIWRVETPRHGTLCAKRALAKLRVAADWHAPVERNTYEARWLEVAAAAVPGSAPRLLGQHAGLGVLVMEWLDERQHDSWKSLLRDGVADAATAAAVGRTLVRIHAWSAAHAGELAPRFESDTIFHDIRLEPYLVATARRHADVATTLHALVARTQAHRCALVHGDVSPKNILIGARGPVLLDAECAWWGDPAFDVAFCLNHLLLKCLWNPRATAALLGCFDALAAAWLAGVDWENRTAVEARAATLLPGLFLARIDGKSPVEYVTEQAQRDAVRRTARALLRAAPARLADVRDAWGDELAQRGGYPA